MIMKPGFTIQHKNMNAIAGSLIIVVSNYLADNEVINWGGTTAGERTRSDVGIWKIKLKSHAGAA